MSETTHTPRITNYENEVYELIRAESARRRNGGRGLSLTVNQIILEWAEAYAAGLVPLSPEQRERIASTPSPRPVQNPNGKE